MPPVSQYTDEERAEAQKQVDLLKGASENVSQQAPQTEIARPLISASVATPEEEEAPTLPPNALASFTHGAGGWFKNKKSGKMEYRVYDSDPRRTAARRAAGTQGARSNHFVIDADEEDELMSYEGAAAAHARAEENYNLAPVASELFGQEISNVHEMPQEYQDMTRAFDAFTKVSQQTDATTDMKRKAQQGLVDQLNNAVISGDEFAAVSLTNAIAESPFSTASYLGDLAGNMSDTHLRKALREGEKRKLNQEFLSEWTRTGGDYESIKGATERLDISADRDSAEVLMALQQNEARRGLLDDPGATDELRHILQASERHRAVGPQRHAEYLNYLAGGWDKQEEQPTAEYEAAQLGRGDLSDKRWEASRDMPFDNILRTEEKEAGSQEMIETAVQRLTDRLGRTPTYQEIHDEVEALGAVRGPREKRSK